MRRVLNTMDIIDLIDYIDTTLERYGYNGLKDLAKLEKYSIVNGKPSLRSIAELTQKLLLYGSKSLNQYLSNEESFASLINEITKLDENLRELLGIEAESILKIANVLDEKGLNDDASLFYLEYINRKTMANTGLRGLQSPIEALMLIQKNIPSLNSPIEYILEGIDTYHCFPGSICILKISHLTRELRSIATSIKNHSFDPQESRRTVLRLIKERIREISKNILGTSEALIVLSLEDITQELLDNSDPRILLLFNNKDGLLESVVDALEYTSIMIYQENGENEKDDVPLSLEYMWKKRAAKLKNELVKYYVKHPVMTIYKSLESVYDMLSPNYSPGLKVIGNELYVCTDIHGEASCHELNKEIIELARELTDKLAVDMIEITDMEKIIRKIGFSIFVEIL